MFSCIVVTEHLSITGHTKLLSFRLPFLLQLEHHFDSFEILCVGSCITYEFHFRIAKMYYKILLWKVGIGLDGVETL